MRECAEGINVGQRILIAVTTILLAAGFGVVCVYFTLIWPVSCGGDGGSPYHALASPAGKYCDRTERSPLEPILYALLTLPVWGTLLAGVIGVVRGRFRPLLWSIVASVLALAAVGGPFVVLDGDCTAEQRDRLPSRQCETYN